MSLLMAGGNLKIVSVLIAILIFSVVVLFHELGHCLLAKANGIRVNEFSLGLGPTLFGIRKGETFYCVKLLPFGGACMLEGEEDESSDERAFGNKPVWSRMSVVFAGPLFNFIMAFVFALFLLGSIGYDRPVIGGVIDGYAAEEAGLKEGDEIRKLNGHSIHFYREISAYSTFHAGEAVDVVYLRGGEEFQTTLVPKYDEESGRYLYGFIGSAVRQKGSVGETVINSFYEVKYWIEMTLKSIRMLVSGGASINDLSGPVGIVTNIGDTYQQSVKNDGYFYAFLNMLNWAILLAANLGVMNLLPFPGLDGGRLVFLLVEAIRRKPIPQEKEGWIHAVGIVLLLSLMVVVMFNDIRKLFI